MSDTSGRRIGVYGGTFDPVHTGHVRVARAFEEQIPADALYMIPCRIPPHKRRFEGANDYLRLRMLGAAFGNDRKAVVSDMELRKDETSYTINTLLEMKRAEPDALLMLIVGADMFLTLRRWYRAEEIFALCEICVYPRGDSSIQALEKYAQGLASDFGVKVHFLKGKKIAAASSEIRRRLKSGESVKGMLPHGVGAIIAETGVYLSEAQKLAAYRRLAKKSVCHSRWRHILRVEAEAACLARRYGADEYKARAAALLHDITKDKSPKEQLQSAEEFGIIKISDLEKSPKVAHAFTAAGYIEKYLSVDDEDIINAVRYHTTGRPDMSLLEKIVFIADGTEKGRKFAGVGELRRAAAEDIDMALLLALRATKAKIEKKGAYLHPDTADAIAYYEKRANI